ncbi:type II toxin-antitoxin system HipA family toxin [Alkalilimnicola ehrlichii]|uniref:type II toxin-antitoxin system HipA family toxin n=1 Tax=Alkalilimnicola ehrlichii TaxID=351052 RepID=UPI003BA250AD
MPRRRRHPPLHVLLNNRHVGQLQKAVDGAISFTYEQNWLDWDHALPVSLSLPLREDPYRGAPVAAVFDNLLPDAEPLRRRVAERVGAEGTDAYSLLSAIGHDCVGALQFVGPDAPAPGDTTQISGQVIDEDDIGRLLRGLAQAPLGLDRDEAFRISIAGAQEKTALLRHEGRWLKPHGTTPTSHILKPQIGQLPNSIDLSNSVENEYYCLKLAAAFGLPVNRAEIHTFGPTQALVVERFDRHWTHDGRLLRLPQEDCCQALSVPPTCKYQTEGGPGIVQLLELLNGSDTPAEDQATVFKAQIFFWLIGATDGHAKNFSLFLRPQGAFRLTPLYDILTVQPSLAGRQIERKQMKLAMAVGRGNRYRIHEIQGRHFLQTGAAARLPRTLATNVIEDIVTRADNAITQVESALPPDFPPAIHESVKAAIAGRLGVLQRAG